MKLADVVQVVEELNERGFEYVGHAMWSIATNGEHVAVFLQGICVWDSEEDEREEVDLALFLPRRACEIAREIIGACDHFRMIQRSKKERPNVVRHTERHSDLNRKHRNTR